MTSKETTKERRFIGGVLRIFQQSMKGLAKVTGGQTSKSSKERPVAGSSVDTNVLHRKQTTDCDGNPDTSASISHTGSTKNKVVASSVCVKKDSVKMHRGGKGEPGEMICDDGTGDSRSASHPMSFNRLGHLRNLEYPVARGSGQSNRSIKNKSSKGGVVSSQHSTSTTGGSREMEFHNSCSRRERPRSAVTGHPKGFRDGKLVDCVKSKSEETSVSREVTVVGEDWSSELMDVPLEAERKGSGCEVSSDTCSHYDSVFSRVLGSYSETDTSCVLSKSVDTSPENTDTSKLVDVKYSKGKTSEKYQKEKQPWKNSVMVVEEDWSVDCVVTHSNEKEGSTKSSDSASETVSYKSEIHTSKEQSLREIAEVDKKPPSFADFPKKVDEQVPCGKSSEQAVPECNTETTNLQIKNDKAKCRLSKTAEDRQSGGQESHQHGLSEIQPTSLQLSSKMHETDQKQEKQCDESVEQKNEMLFQNFVQSKISEPDVGKHAVSETHDKQHIQQGEQSVHKTIDKSDSHQQNIKSNRPSLVKEMEHSINHSKEQKQICSRACNVNDVQKRPQTRHQQPSCFNSHVNSVTRGCRRYSQQIRNRGGLSRPTFHPQNNFVIQEDWTNELDQLDEPVSVLITDKEPADSVSVARDTSVNSQAPSVNCNMEQKIITSSEHDELWSLADKAESVDEDVKSKEKQSKIETNESKKSGRFGFTARDSMDNYETNESDKMEPLGLPKNSEQDIRAVGNNVSYVEDCVKNPMEHDKDFWTSTVDEINEMELVKSLVDSAPKCCNNEEVFTEKYQNVQEATTQGEIMEQEAMSGQNFLNNENKLVKTGSNVDKKSKKIRFENFQKYQEKNTHGTIPVDGDSGSETDSDCFYRGYRRDSDSSESDVLPPFERFSEGESLPDSDVIIVSSSTSCSSAGYEAVRSTDSGESIISSEKNHLNLTNKQKHGLLSNTCQSEEVGYSRMVSSDDQDEKIRNEASTDLLKIVHLGKMESESVQMSKNIQKTDVKFKELLDIDPSIVCIRSCAFESKSCNKGTVVESKDSQDSRSKEMKSVESVSDVLFHTDSRGVEVDSKTKSENEFDDVHKDLQSSVSKRGPSRGKKNSNGRRTSSRGGRGSSESGTETLTVDKAPSVTAQFDREVPPRFRKKGRASAKIGESGMSHELYHRNLHVSKNATEILNKATEPASHETWAVKNCLPSKEMSQRTMAADTHWSSSSQQLSEGRDSELSKEIGVKRVNRYSEDDMSQGCRRVPSLKLPVTEDWNLDCRDVCISDSSDIPGIHDLKSHTGENCVGKDGSDVAVACPGLADSLRIDSMTEDTGSFLLLDDGQARGIHSQEDLDLYQGDVSSDLPVEDCVVTGNTAAGLPQTASTPMNSNCYPGPGSRTEIFFRYPQDKHLQYPQVPTNHLQNPENWYHQSSAYQYEAYRRHYYQMYTAALAHYDYTIHAGYPSPWLYQDQQYGYVPGQPCPSVTNPHFQSTRSDTGEMSDYQGRRDARMSEYWTERLPYWVQEQSLKVAPSEEEASVTSLNDHARSSIYVNHGQHYYEMTGAEHQRNRPASLVAPGPRYPLSQYPGPAFALSPASRLPIDYLGTQYYLNTNANACDVDESDVESEISEHPNITQSATPAREITSEACPTMEATLQSSPTRNTTQTHDGGISDGNSRKVNCCCDLEDVQFWIWRTCMCSAGLWPRLKNVLPVYPVERNLDQGYQSYESVGDHDDSVPVLTPEALSAPQQDPRENPAPTHQSSARIDQSKHHLHPRPQALTQAVDTLSRVLAKQILNTMDEVTGYEEEQNSGRPRYGPPIIEALAGQARNVALKSLYDRGNVKKEKESADEKFSSDSDNLQSVSGSKTSAVESYQGNVALDTDHLVTSGNQHGQRVDHSAWNQSEATQLEKLSVERKIGPLCLEASASHLASASSHLNKAEVTQGSLNDVLTNINLALVQIRKSLKPGRATEEQEEVESVSPSRVEISPADSTQSDLKPCKPSTVTGVKQQEVKEEGSLEELEALAADQTNNSPLLDSPRSSVESRQEVISQECVTVKIKSDSGKVDIIGPENNSEPEDIPDNAMLQRDFNPSVGAMGPNLHTDPRDTVYSPGPRMNRNLRTYFRPRVPITEVGGYPYPCTVPSPPGYHRTPPVHQYPSPGRTPAPWCRPPYPGTTVPPSHCYMFPPPPPPPPTQPPVTPPPLHPSSTVETPGTSSPAASPLVDLYSYPPLDLYKSPPSEVKGSGVAKCQPSLRMCRFPFKMESSRPLMKSLTKLVDYEISEDESSSDVGDKGNENSLAARKRFKSDTSDDESPCNSYNVEGKHRPATMPDNTSVTILRRTQKKLTQKSLKSYSDTTLKLTDVEPQKPVFKPTSFVEAVSKKKSRGFEPVLEGATVSSPIELKQDAEDGDDTSGTDIKPASQEFDSSSGAVLLPPLPPLPPFPASPFWGMYLTDSNSALTGFENGSYYSPPAASAGSKLNQSPVTCHTPEPYRPKKSWSSGHLITSPVSRSGYTSSYSPSETDSDTLSLRHNWRANFKTVYNFGIKYIDTHCHLDFLFNRLGFRGNLRKFIETHPETFPNTFEGCVAVFCNPASFVTRGLWLEVAEESNVWIAMGCHPKMATEFSDMAEHGLLKCLQHSKMVAVGEIGLDYSGTFRQHESVQKRVFRRHIKIALELKKPIVIHCRDAEEDCLDILKEMVPVDYKIHCHCFTGWYHNARLWLDAFPNLYIGLTPLVTFHTAKPSHDLARRIPLDRLLLETDAPYFIPRHIPKEEIHFSNPGLAIAVAKEVARYQGIPVSTVLMQCRINSNKMYGI